MQKQSKKMEVFWSSVISAEEEEDRCVPVGMKEPSKMKANEIKKYKIT